MLPRIVVASKKFFRVIFSFLMLLQRKFNLMTSLEEYRNKNVSMVSGEQINLKIIHPELDTEERVIRGFIFSRPDKLRVGPTRVASAATSTMFSEGSISMRNRGPTFCQVITSFIELS